MSANQKERVEYGDFQTPSDLALAVCRRLVDLGIDPTTVIEPTCGTGSFIAAAAEVFPSVRQIIGFELNEDHLSAARMRSAVLSSAISSGIRVEMADFFATDWQDRLANVRDPVLVLGNLPWVTNAVQGSIGGMNLPAKTNFLGHRGFDAITGKANFDISEWMLLEVLRWFERMSGDLAMLVKSSVARKVLAHAERQGAPIADACLIGVDAKKHFDVFVDACVLVIRFTPDRRNARYDYTMLADLEDRAGKRVGHRMGLTVGDLEAFDASAFLIGASPQKWRSGVKHDASSVMELTRVPGGFVNGFGEVADLEPTYLYPLFKGSDIGSGKGWREKYVIATQKRVGEGTAAIEHEAPKTWRYLLQHGEQLDARASTIYMKGPRFSIFGVGEYAFRPWKIAVCSLYKALRFRIVGPIDERPAMFDDTVYYLSFDTELEAAATLERLESAPAQQLLKSLIFWDDKRPIKTSILNVLDWSKLESTRPFPSQTTRPLF